MASIKEKISLKLELDNGVVDGKQKVLSKSFARVNTAAEDTNLFNAATAIGGLQEKSLLKIQKIETTTLSND